ncbi:IS66 family transposase [Mesorhizobium sp. VK22B]|uniref:IS66 family transposase n=1 Tax=Mesorhizobium captivum TaxID=3072319 RepID=A0ABU4ZBM8_9HYPH|nr:MULTISPECIES: IS66 family transposase [unclassified Mesorhizobium]MDX8496712.1 IS66 family transposase [Mesorhizobium sp. VK22B]MDX8505619.1 IS66 family transposase [Mesorhizobium sp. VK22E]
MRLDLDNLPTEPALLQHLVRDIAALVEHRDGEIERLKSIIKQLQRAQFGRRSEQLDPDQLALALEDLDGDLAREVESRPRVDKQQRDLPSRKPLPDHLPREDVRLDVDDNICKGCGGVLHLIGESVSEMLDWVPAKLRVIRTTRPKYACRTCETVVQAPAPERPIAGGLATPALLAQVLVSKYCDHTPLYRQSQIFARHGVDLPRSTLAGWVGGACWWLEALHERLAKSVFASDHLFADDTPVPVLDPGRGRTKTGRLWVYAREQRAWAGPEPPAAIYMFAPDRKAERPASHLEHFKGVLHVDGYAGFEQLTGKGNIVLAACWSHTRRKFYDVAQATDAPIAVEALRRIGQLYAVEADVRGQSPAHRLASRRSRSKPIVDAMRAWLEAQLPLLPGRSTLAEAIRYALPRWEGLTRFLHDGRIELDTNPVERAIRPIALGRKNHLFAGSDGGGHRWAVLCSLIETCKLNGVEPYTYLHDVLSRMVDGHSINRLDELLPWAWKAGNPVKS